MLVGLDATSHCALHYGSKSSLHYGFKMLEQLQPTLRLQNAKNARAVGGFETCSLNLTFEPRFSCAAGKQ